MGRSLGALWLLLITSSVGAQDVQLHITGGDSVVVKIDKVVIVKEDRLVVRSLPFKLNATAGAADYRWTVPAGVTATETDDVLNVTGAPKGELTISVRVLIVDFEKKLTKRTTESLTFNVGDVVPTPPVPPPPPIPPPDPKPPPPIPLAGFRVLIVYDPAALTPNQGGIVFGKKIRDYLQAKCIVGADGKTKDFRIYQTGLDTSAEVAWINDTIQRHPGQKTYLVVSNGTTGYDGPLPASADEAMAILTKIGGQ